MNDGEEVVACDGSTERRDVYSIEVGILLARELLKREGVWGESGQHRSYTSVKSLTLLMPWREWRYVPEE
jgi:hypothetical protein